MANLADTLQRTLDNYGRVWLLCTELVASSGGQPTQAQVDTLLSTAEGAGVIRPRVSNNVDGQQYQWTEYQQALEDIMAGVKRQLIFAQGLYEVRNVAR